MLNVNVKYYIKRNGENIILRSVQCLFPSLSVNLCESIELADIYGYCVGFFFNIIYTFNSNIEICIAVETI